MVGPRSWPYLPLQLGDPVARLIETTNFGLHLMRQVGKFREYPANGFGWHRCSKQMTFAWPGMGGSDPIGPKIGLESWPKRIEFALFQITKLKTIRLRKTTCIRALV